MAVEQTHLKYIYWTTYLQLVLISVVITQIHTFIRLEYLDSPQNVYKMGAML